MIVVLIDVIILLLILSGGFAGSKNGAIKKAIELLGLILVVIFSFMLKNRLSALFYENLPFIKLWGVFKGVQVLNILFYEIIAFLIISTLLMALYNVILKLGGFVEKLLDATFIFGVTSKIWGFILGLVESYIWVYILLFILTLPVINIRQIYDSKIAVYILNKTPIISRYTSKTVEIYNDVYEIIDNREDKSNEQLNEEVLDSMLKYKVVTVESAEKLIDKKKVSVNDKSFIEKYK